MKKIKLLFFGDSPAHCDTGFATVSKNILKRLHATGKYDITCVGINYYGMPHDLPYKIYPAGINNQGDIYGRQVLLDMLRHDKSDYDVLFTLQDTFIMATIGESLKKLRDGSIVTKQIINEDGKVEEKKVFQRGKGFKWVYYYPIDSTPDKEWIEKSVAFADVAVPYTKYAEKESKKIVDRKYEIIYHGFDKETFKVISEEEKQKFRDKFFKDNRLKDRFLIVNVNRNQIRKGMLQTFLMFKIFNKIFPKSVLYTHCDLYDQAGYNLMDLAKKLGINDNWLYPNPEHYKQGRSFDVGFMNGLYNIADVNISTTLGEGFGLSMVEAMAAKTINLFPRNTAIEEILENKRGIMVDSGLSANNLMCNGPLDNNQIRPTVNVEDMVGKLIWIYSHPEQKKEIEERAYDWAQENLDWDKLCIAWDELICKIIK